MADKLLPCPFCVGDNTDIISADIIAGTQYWRIHCYGCGCTQTPVSDKEEAIEKWNNRSSIWHTGTPTEEGWYLVAFNFHEGEIRYETWYYPNKMTWDNNNFGLLAWQKIVPYKED